MKAKTENGVKNVQEPKMAEVFKALCNTERQ